MSTETETNQTNLKIFERVASYPVVQSLYSSAKGYYNTAKETNSYVKYGLEQAEHKLNDLAEVSKPVLKKLEEPQYQQYIKNADSFASRQLDFIENRVSTAKQALNALSERKEELKTGALNSVKNAIETPAVQQTADLVRNTVNNYLTSTEHFVDRVLPEANEQKPRDAANPAEEPLYLRVYHLTSKVGHRVGNQVAERLPNLKFRSVEDLKNYTYVNLIEYSKYLDSYLPPNAQIATLTEKAEPVRKQVTEKVTTYATTFTTRVQEYKSALERNPTTAPYVNLVTSFLHPTTLREKLPGLLSSVNESNWKAAATFKDQLLASPFSQLFYQNATTTLAFVRNYATVARGVELAKNIVYDLQVRSEAFLKGTKTSNVVIEEVNEVVEKVEDEARNKVVESEKDEPEAEKSPEQAEVEVEQNGHHLKEEPTVNGNGTAKSEDDEEEEEENEEVPKTNEETD